MEIRKVGIMLSELASGSLPVLFRAAGLDFFILDCEHGGFDYGAVSRIVLSARLCGIMCIIRIADNSRKDIQKFMDMGAEGLLLPMTNEAQDIAQVVRYAKYRPVGGRGISTMRAHTLYAPPPIAEYVREANAHTRVYAQIETRRGVQNIAQILSVAGVDGCFVGPNDLSDDLGCLGQAHAQPVLDVISRVGKAAAQQGRQAGIITSDAAYLSAAKGAGFSLFCKGSELNAVKEYCRAVVDDICGE